MGIKALLLAGGRFLRLGGGGFLALAGGATNPFPYLPTPVYDTGMGIPGVTGYIAAPALDQTARNGKYAQQIWVDSIHGSDSNNGLSPYSGYEMNGTGPGTGGSPCQWGATGQGTANAAFGPVATYAKALNIAQTGTGGTTGGLANQFYFAEGGSYPCASITNPFQKYAGYSISNPACFQSYDPNDPLNSSKYGMAGTSYGGGGGRPLFTVSTGNFPGIIALSGGTQGTQWNNWLLRGLNFSDTSTNSPNASWVGSNSNMLFENMVWNQVVPVWQTLDNVYNTSNNIIVRRCVSMGQYADNGAHQCGTFLAQASVTFEDSIFYHNGWSTAATRAVGSSAGGGDIFKHSIYAHSVVAACLSRLRPPGFPSAAMSPPTIMSCWIAPSGTSMRVDQAEIGRLRPDVLNRATATYA